MKIKIEKQPNGKYRLLSPKVTGVFFKKETWEIVDWRDYDNLEDAQARAKFLVTPYTEIVEA